MKKNHCVAVAVFLMCLAAGLDASEIRVGQKEPFKQINQALKEAKPGDTVFITEGEYQENIVLPSGINLRGEDPNKTIIKAGPAGQGRTFVLTAKGQGSVRIENLSFSSTEKTVEGLSLGQCTAQINNCHIKGFSVAGISAYEKARVEVKDCIIEECQRGISAFGQGTELVVTNCTLRKNKDVGVILYEGPTGKITQTNVFEQDQRGICFYGRATKVDITDCRVYGNSKAGIHLWAGAHGTIRGTTCENNESGIIASDPNTQCDIEDCRLQSNRQYGVYLYTAAQGLIRKSVMSGNTRNGVYLTKNKLCHVEQNRCSKNGVNGISAEGKITEAVMISNTCSENGYSGIYSGYGFQGRIEKNICQSNAENGIKIDQSVGDVAVAENDCSQNKFNGIVCIKGASAALLRNQCSQNGNYGIYMDSTACPSLDANICKDNHQKDEYQEQGYSGPIRAKFLAGEFEALEAIKEHLRKDKVYNDAGGLKLFYFYAELSSYWTGSDKSIKAFEDTIEKWCKEKPESATPRILRAEFYRNCAWEARGDGWAQYVPKEAWPIFNDYLQKAWQLLQEAGNMKNKDPHLYHDVLVLCKALSMSNDMMEQTLEKGEQCDPAYHYFYNERAWSLLPRWGGRPGQVGQYAEQIAEKYKNNGGLEYYARTAKSIYDPYHENFLKHGFSYEKIKQGHLELIKKFKPFHWQNSLCVFACLYGDKETAREMFKIIGENDNNIEGDIWKNDELFYNQARAWVAGQRKEPPVPTTENQKTVKDVYKGTTE